VLGYYLQLSKALIASRDGVGESLLILRAGQAIPEVCYESRHPDDILGEANYSASSIDAIIPGKVCPLDCPCNQTAARCLSDGSCFSTEPLANILWVHVIRHPLDIIYSAYHSLKSMQGEGSTVNFGKHGAKLLEKGVPFEMLEKAGYFDQNHQNVTFYKVLNRVQDEQGFLMVFLSISVDLWKMARQQLRLSRLKTSGRSLLLKYEDIASHPLKTWGPMLTSLSNPCIDAKREEFEQTIMTKCTSNRTALDPSLKEFPSDKESLKGLETLKKDPFVLDQICQLERILGYKSSSLCVSGSSFGRVFKWVRKF
jgi:hypothetical protein